MPVLFVVPTARKGPGFVWVIVTVFVLDAAVAPTAELPELQAVIWAATLAAKVDVLPLVTKVPPVEPVHVAEPLVPGTTLPHE